MKIVMMGSGGVGGFFGGRLAHAGYDVTFIARGAHFAAMRDHGLVIESNNKGRIHVPHVKVTDRATDLDEVDLIILSVKLWDTEVAVSAMRALVGPHTGVLSLQNGVIKDDILRRAFGSDAVMGGVGYVASHIQDPGVIHQTGTMQRLVVGEYDGCKSRRVEFLYQALRHAGIDSEISADVRKAIWEKYVFLVGLSATTTVMRRSLGPIRTNSQTRSFLRQIFQEVVTVAHAYGVGLPKDYADDRLAFADTMPADMTSSMHHDLLKGNPLELNWLSGGVVQLGRAKDIPTPANEAVCAALALDAGGRNDKFRTVS